MRIFLTIIVIIILCLPGYAQADTSSLPSNKANFIKRELMIASGGFFSSNNQFGLFYNQFDPGFGVSLEHAWIQDNLGFGVNASFLQSGYLNDPKFFGKLYPTFRELLVVPAKNSFGISAVGKVDVKLYFDTEIHFLLELGYNRQVITECTFIDHGLSPYSDLKYEYSKIASNGAFLGYGIEYKIPLNEKISILFFGKNQFNILFDKYVLTIADNPRNKAGLSFNSLFYVGVGMYYSLNPQK